MAATVGGAHCVGARPTVVDGQREKWVIGVDDEVERSVGIDLGEHVAVRRRTLDEAPLVDHGHAAGELAGGLDRDMASDALEQVGMGDGQHGERVVDRRRRRSRPGRVRRR